MNSVCRLCFGVKGVEVPIFGESNEIYEKLTSCLSIKVCNIDQLSKKICYTCNDKVEEFFVFRRTALDVEKRLCSLVLDTNGQNALQITEQMDNVFFIKPEISEDLVQITNLSKATQTDAFSLCHVNVKQEVDGSVCSERSYINDTLDFPESSVPHSENAANSTLGESHSRSRRKSRRPRKNKKEPAEMEALSQMFNSDEDNTALINLAPVKKEEAPDSPLNLITGTIWDDVEKKEELDEDQSDEKLCCCVCYEFKSTKTEMIAHYRTHKHEAENKMSIGVNTGKIRPDEDGFYECTICKKSYDKKPRFLEHIAVHKTVRSRPFQCSLCEKTFTEVVQILKHGKTHTYENCIVENCPTAHRGICPSDHLSMNKATPRPVTKRFICDICNEGFVYMRYLKFHRSKLHPEAKGQLVIRCMQCSKEFSHLNSLRRHLRSHSGEKNFLCYICGKALSSKEHLKFHISIHTGHKPHICKTCGKGFVKKCNLILHERVHSGERPHVCSHCGKAFSQRSTLVIHERYHSGARPYVCTLCNKGFVARGLLSMHLKTTCI